MSPQQFKNSLYVDVSKRHGLTVVRVGIRLEAVTQIDSDKQEDIKEAEELGRQTVTEGVYGGRREELRQLINNLPGISHINNELAMEEYIKALNGLIAFQKTL